jgi:hypothetical protein
MTVCSIRTINYRPYGFITFAELLGYYDSLFNSVYFSPSYTKGLVLMVRTKNDSTGRMSRCTNFSSFVLNCSL